jgi:hypothetical protein
MGYHVFNLFEITNLHGLQTRYRLVEIDGTYGADDLADQNLSRLVKRVAYSERAPVALIHRNGKPFLAVPADLTFGTDEYQLTPHVVDLKPLDEEYDLSLGSLTAETERIGMAFLLFHLKSPLWARQGLWSSNASTYFSKRPANYRDDRRDVDVYEGFGFRLLRYGGKLYLSLSLTNKPLYIRVVKGDLDFSKVLEDTFAMSQLCWPVPNRCIRLPIDLKLCDDLLRATASDADEDEALYGEEESEHGDEAEIGVSLPH